MNRRHVVDGSPAPSFDRHARVLPPGVRHVRPDPRRLRLGGNGKVHGVLTGVSLARHERLVVADDDVRYTRADLQRILRLLDGADLVRPQNYVEPLPWHARWDTGRTLLNRALASDYPGTLALRRSLLLAAGGYSAEALFALALARPTNRQVAALGCAVVALAELGRRRRGGRAVFRPTAALWAPLWLAERSVCSWLAVISRARGGVRYAGGRMRLAAHPERRLRRTVGPRLPGPARRPTPQPRESTPAGYRCPT